MEFKDEFIEDVVGGLTDRIAYMDMRPMVEMWPGEDDFAEWVASHQVRERAVICSTPEFKDTPFCGTGCH